MYLENRKPVNEIQAQVMTNVRFVDGLSCGFDLTRAKPESVGVLCSCSKNMFVDVLFFLQSI